MKNFAGKDFDRMFGGDNYRTKTKMKSKKNWTDVEDNKKFKKSKRMKYNEFEW